MHGSDEHDSGAGLGLHDHHSLRHASQRGESAERHCADQEGGEHPAKHFPTTTDRRTTRESLMEKTRR